MTVGRWGGRASPHAQSRSWPTGDAEQNLQRPESGGNALSAISESRFNGQQGKGRPGFETPESSPDMARGGSSGTATDGSRFEVRYNPVEDEPWEVWDAADESVKRFGTKEDVEKHMLDENRAPLLKERDDRKEINDASGRWGGRKSEHSGARDHDITTDPPVSEAQRKWAFANKDKGGKEGAAAKEYADADPGGKLPAKAG